MEGLGEELQTKCFERRLVKEVGWGGGWGVRVHRCRRRQLLIEDVEAQLRKKREAFALVI